VRVYEAASQGAPDSMSGMVWHQLARYVELIADKLRDATSAGAQVNVLDLKRVEIDSDLEVQNGLIRARATFTVRVVVQET
jgi:hypothetical protein